MTLELYIALLFILLLIFFLALLAIHEVEEAGKAWRRLQQARNEAIYRILRR